jgi:hypothetical protein
MINKLVLALAAAGLATSANAVTNLIVNPSFEMGTGVSSDKAPGSTDIVGWDIPAPPTRFGVYYAGSDDWVAADGTRSVELGTAGGPGMISQTVALEVGKQYELSFSYAADPAGLNSPVNFYVFAQGATVSIESFVRDPSFDTTNPGWTTQSFRFIADRVNTRITFNTNAAGSNAQTNALIDFVSLTAVPEPATWALLIAGFGMVGFSMRRRRSALTSVTN